MLKPTFTVEQQIAAFTISADAAADFSFTSPADMQDYVTKMSQINLADPVIQGYIGSDWTPSGNRSRSPDSWE